MFLTRLTTFSNARCLVGSGRKTSVASSALSSTRDDNTVIRTYQISEYSARVCVFYYGAWRHLNFHVLPIRACHRLWAAASPWLGFKMNSALKQSEGIQLWI